MERCRLEFNSDRSELSTLKALKDLEDSLSQKFPIMKGVWVEKGSGYEHEFAECIDARLERGTYWDLEKDGVRIEVKKGQTGSWFDLTRYCDMMEKIEDWRDIVTLFLHYKKGARQIESVIGVTMESLIDALHLTPTARMAIQQARDLLKPSKDSKLNFQSRLTLDELRKIGRQKPSFLIPAEPPD